MKNYSVIFKWVSPDKKDTLTLYFFSTTDAAEATEKAKKAFKERVEQIWNCNISDIDILEVTTDLLQSGIFLERRLT